MRRFPPPWTIEELDGGFKIVDANGSLLPMSMDSTMRPMLQSPNH